MHSDNGDLCRSCEMQLIEKDMKHLEEIMTEFHNSGNTQYCGPNSEKDLRHLEKAIQGENAGV